MSKMGNHLLKVMYCIEKFVGFPAMNFGIKLFVSFQLLPLVLGGQGCGKKRVLV